MVGVADPSGLFLGDRGRDAPGSSVVTALEGRRPLLVEVQALVSRATSPSPRRSAQGVDGGRVAQLLAVLERRAGLAIGAGDVFVSAVGGVRLTEPAADLGIALALVSAASGRAVPADLVAVGEVGLGGELRLVPHTARRLAEAGRLGFGRALVPASAPAGPDGLEVIRAGSVAEAIAALGIDAPARVGARAAVAARVDGPWVGSAPARGRRATAGFRVVQGARPSGTRWPSAHAPPGRRPF
jgi:DNA repair protein RadA/Sms